jgi:hypothetical protein
VAIVVEDGTVVANANSYLSVADVPLFTLERGVTLSATDSVVEVQLVKAKDYINSREHHFVGARKSAAQTLAWPRIVGGTDLLVPQKIREAQGFLVMASAGLIDILPVATEQPAFPIKSEKVGPLETAYAVADGEAVDPWPRVPAAEEAIAFYFTGIARIKFRYLGKTY